MARTTITRNRGWKSRRAVLFFCLVYRLSKAATRIQRMNEKIPCGTSARRTEQYKLEDDVGWWRGTRLQSPGFETISRRSRAIFFSITSDHDILSPARLLCRFHLYGHIGSLRTLSSLAIRCHHFHTITVKSHIGRRSLCSILASDHLSSRVNYLECVLLRRIC